MSSEQLDFLSIGDIAVDAFIRIKDAAVYCDIDKDNCKLCMSFADKVPYESVEIIYGTGNSVNVAVAASRLGLKAGVVSDIGDDMNGRKCLDSMDDEHVDTRYVSIQKRMRTNYHYVLWYETDRTILVKHEEYEYKLPEIDPPKWLYLTSLPSHAEKYHEEIVSYLKAHPEIKLVFQPGTFQIKLGREKLSHIYENAEILIVNSGEAEKIVGEHAEIKILLGKLAALGPKIVIITNAAEGSYMRENGQNWFMRSYPDTNVLERTGAGDAFSATFVSALILGKNPSEALKWAPANSLSVIQSVGPQKGLLTQKKIEEMISKAPADYEPKKI